MDKLEYLNYVVANLKPIVLKVKGLDITDIITTLNNNIEFKVSKEIKVEELKIIQTEIDSNLNNWIIIELSGNRNGDGNYFYRVVNLVFEKDVIWYNREQGLKSLI